MSQYTSTGHHPQHSIPMMKRGGSVMVKACFFQLRLLSNLKPILSTGNLETVIHAFINDCNTLLYGISQIAISRLPLVRKRAHLQFMHPYSLKFMFLNVLTVLPPLLSLNCGSHISHSTI
ncbi:hypothetical protein AMECASPLE_026656 [Ameca splendens]|uniref:Uncharacterized protein n=1 Tax=Ameca splendens TaxID=208324 RepID=A0ABV0YRZ0_9TELE